MAWIRAKEAIGQPVFQKTFFWERAEAGKRRGSVVMEMTGLGLYRAELNGRRVGDDYLTPGWNDYDAYVRYQSYDVTDLLQERNELRVTLAEGWYMGRLGMSSGRDRHWGDTFMLWARLLFRSEDGEELLFETDEDWTACRSNIRMASLYDGEDRDDTAEPGEPIPVEVVDPSCCPCLPERDETPRIRCVEERRPVRLDMPDGETVLDFGQNFSGILRFHSRLLKGERVYFETAEVLEQGRFYRDNLLTARSAFSYISDGIEKDVEETFTFHGFRYVRVTGSREIRAEDVTGVVLSSDLRETLRWKIGHAGLDRLLQNARWSRLSNFLDVPTDCPQRDERLGWTGDAQVFADTACMQADCRAFYRKYMRDLREDQVRYYAGDLPMFSPSLRGEAGVGGAVWADVGVILPWSVYMHYGDLDLLRETYPLMRDYTEKRIEKDRALGNTHIRFDEFSFGDWLALDGIARKSVFGGTEETYIQGVYYLQALELTEKAAEALGEAEDAARYGKLAGEVRERLMAEYVTEGGRLSVDTQTGYVLALRHRLWRDHGTMTDDFRRRLQRDAYEIRCGFTGAPLLISTLLDHGMVDEAYRMLLSWDYPGWLYEVRSGATTIWERWNSLEEDGRVSDTGMDSFNHYAYGSVCHAVYTRIMGLRCLEPGWKRAEVAPKIRGQIPWSEIRLETVSGTWFVSWRIHQDGTFSMRVCVPEGCEAEIELPDGEAEDRPREVVGPGVHTYTYRPGRDWLHPFGEDSLILDLIRCPEAAEVFARHAPDLYALACDRDTDVRCRRLSELSWGIPRRVREQAKGLGEKLRAVTLKTSEE